MGVAGQKKKKKKKQAKKKQKNITYSSDIVMQTTQKHPFILLSNINPGTVIIASPTSQK